MHPKYYPFHLRSAPRSVVTRTNADLPFNVFICRGDISLQLVMKLNCWKIASIILCSGLLHVWFLIQPLVSVQPQNNMLMFYFTCQFQTDFSVKYEEVFSHKANPQFCPLSLLKTSRGRLECCSH